MPNLSCGVKRPCAAASERAKAIASPSTAMSMSTLLAEKDVAKRSAHEIDALGAVTQRGDCFDDRLQLVERAKLVRRDSVPP